MGQATEDRKARGKSRMSPLYILLVSFLCLLVGVWIGPVWWKFIRPTVKDAYHRVVDPYHRHAVDADQQRAVDAYQDWWVDKFDWTEEKRYWLGVPIWKFPLDMWVYQEIIYETKPDVLIEAGTYKGGSALFFASMFDLLKHGRVLTIDIVAYPNRPQHERITYLLGSSTSYEIFQKVKDSIRPGEGVMVSLDSDHEKAHVLNELRLYSNIVTVDNYLVVEDTTTTSGAKEALEEFLKTNSNYLQDRGREKFGVTMHGGGWLKRVR